MNKTNYELKQLFWETTLRCNARCRFCGSRCGEVPSDELTTDQIKDAFSSIAQDMDASRIMINITGGEPLLRKDLFEVMTHCTDLGFRWGMVTNGMLITPQIIEKMQAAKMSTVSVSLDGLEQTHEQLRGVAGSFATVIGNIQALVKADFLDHVQVTTVVNRENLHQLEQLYAILRPLGLDSWRVAVVDAIGRATDNTQLLLDTGGLRTYLDFVQRYHKDPVLPVVTSCSHYYGTQETGLGRMGCQCHTGVGVASILANGDIYVCPNVPRIPELIQGNVKIHRFSQIWRDGFQYFRSPQCRQAEQCRDCSHWANCRGDSMHTWDFTENRPGFCYLERLPESRSDDLPTLQQVIDRLKQRYGTIKGIAFHYPQSSDRTLYFTPNAAREMYEFFHWGQWHPLNMSEQMACLIGRPLQDGAVVEFVSPVFLESRSSILAAFSEQSYRCAKEERNAVNRSYLLPGCAQLRLFDSHCQLLGFVHSHPAGLPLAPSEPDLQLHKYLQQVGVPWNILINPQTRRLASFTGEEMEPGKLQLLVPEEQLKLWLNQ